jgi:hypothetical protein
MKSNHFKLYIIAVLVLLNCQCKQEHIKLVSIFFDPSTTAFTEKYRFKASLNNVVILDSVVANTHVAGSLLIHCVTVDTIQSNSLKLTVQQLTREINLNDYHTKCVEVFSHFDDRTRIRNKFHTYEVYAMKHTGVLPDYKLFIDSVKATGTLSKYDSLAVSIQTDKCWCDPKADHHENKGVVPGVIISR